MIFLEKDGTLINTSPDNIYYKKVLKFKEAWDSGQQSFTIHTSGSTGIPKSQTFTRLQLIESAYLTAKTFDLHEGDTAFCCLSVDYIAGMMMLVRAFEIGMDMMIVEPSSSPFTGVEKHLYLLNSNRGKNFFAFVPLQVQTLLEESDKFLDTLNAARNILIGGAGISESLHQQLQKIHAPVYATYGMTETLTHIAIKRVNGSEQENFFTVLEGIEIAQDERDCLKIKSKTTNNEWIVSNDIVELIDERRFKLIGRFDNIINSGGVKIQLEKVEHIGEEVLAKIKFKGRFFAYGVPDNKLGQKLILVVESKKPLSNGNDLGIIFSEKLPKFEIPKEVFFVEKMIETPTGKIDKIKTVNAYVLPQIPNL
ncbi:AMP-binding protein [Emticicia agri]|uniref:O-succinylbenzoic acid--CoA ligase n=1 Tax=Emticicia agri TaxID=2492393 RepID=A0A4Q5LY62_9BACT|nr:AMP-binding protein [Emticicia agri]RYU94836.1 O-succinylbenzoic acid--CoA ligase [Emticicia agri]